MEQIDVKKLEKAIVYLQRIADGHNPVNNTPAEEDSVLNDPNVIRCMFFVKEVLEEVKRNNGYIGKKAKKSNKVSFPIEVLGNFAYDEDKAISKFVNQINELIDETVYQKLNYRLITQWLKTNGFLEENYSREFDKTITLPTDKGVQIGIRAERKRSSRGIEYMSVVYDKYAQNYIIRNMETILCEVN